MSRVEEVIDVWFDSGSMPFAQHHYPFDNQKIFNQHFPADFIAAAIKPNIDYFFYSRHFPITLRATKSDIINIRSMQLEEVIDVWFDSGSMPFAQHHYPFDNQKIFNQHFPRATKSDIINIRSMQLNIFINFIDGIIL
jgi:isoleucyl-tRNA synthetase